MASCRGYFISAHRVQDVRGIRRHSQIGNRALPKEPSVQDAAQTPHALSTAHCPSHPGRAGTSTSATEAGRFYIPSRALDCFSELSGDHLTAHPPFATCSLHFTWQRQWGGQRKEPKMKLPSSPAAHTPCTDHTRLLKKLLLHSTDSSRGSAKAFLIQRETKVSDSILQDQIKLSTQVLSH